MMSAKEPVKRTLNHKIQISVAITPIQLKNLEAEANPLQIPIAEVVRRVLDSHFMMRAKMGV